MIFDETGPYALASALVQIQPEHLQKVSEFIATIPGVDIHLTSDKGQLIITLEGPQPDPLADILTRIKYLDGVLSADLVYQHYEETSDPYCKEMVH